MVDQDNFEVGKTMMAVVTTGNGGYEMLQYCKVPIPTPTKNEVLIRVLAAGVNNTEINTRLGWYSSAVTSATETAAKDQSDAPADKPDGGWSAPTPFPLIQGTDCCGEVVKTGAGVGTALIGKRVLVRPCMRTNGFDDLNTVWMASDFDGAFAQFVTVPASEVFAVDCDWSDAELATIPCAYGTAENMLHRSGVTSGSRVLVAGASGGVGSAAVQLANRRGADVVAITSHDKADLVRDLGASVVVARGADLVREIGENSIDIVVDNVAGDGFGQMLKVLKRGGRFVSSGAIAGPIVTLDMRDMYLKDITLIGCTAWDAPIFPNLISYIERGEICPLVARTFPLAHIENAQREFLRKRHVGNFVLLPPPPNAADT